MKEGYLANQYLSNSENLKNQHLSLFKDINSSLEKLQAHKNLLIKELMPASSKLTKNPTPQVFNYLAKTSLKIQTRLISELSKIINSASQKKQTLEKHLELSLQFKQALEKEYETVILLLNQGGDNPLKQKLEKQRYSLILALQKQEHLINLIEYNTKLFNKFTESFDYKASLVEKEVELLRFYSKYDTIIPNHRRINNAVLQLADKLNETISDEKTSIMQPIFNLLNDKHAIITEMKTIMPKK